MPANSRRDNFAPAVVDVLARRAGMQCSKPGCGQRTSGPRAEPDKAVNIGVAGHITAAAPGGPRYDASLTPEQRSSASNGIWLCQNHAKLVDNDESRYTVDLLRQWKHNAEMAADRAVSGGNNKEEGVCFEVSVYVTRFNEESRTLIVQLMNIGNKTARNLVVEVAHTETHCGALLHNEERWQLESLPGVLTPRKLRYKHELNPDECENVLAIPTLVTRRLQIELTLKVWAADTRMSSFSGTASPDQIEKQTAMFLASGVPSRAVIKPSEKRSQPHGLEARKILGEILAFPKADTRGVSEILGGFPGSPLDVAYVTSTTSIGSGSVYRMRTRLFREAVRELVQLGWLLSSESDGHMNIYEFNPE